MLLIESMFWKEENRPVNSAKETKGESVSDPLFDHDWEVFVVKRDSATGEFVTKTACCEDALSS